MYVCISMYKGPDSSVKNKNRWITYTDHLCIVVKGYKNLPNTS